MIVYLARDIHPFVMYCVNGKPRSSLLIESTDSMIRTYVHADACMLAQCSVIIISLQLYASSNYTVCLASVVNDALGMFVDPFFCVGCSQASYKKELVYLRNTVISMQDEISQLRKILEEKCLYADAFVPPMPQIDEHQTKTEFRMRGVRGRGRDQGRGEERGKSGVGGHRSGGNKGNGWEFVDRVMGETMTGSGVVGSVGAGDVSAKGVGGTSGEGGGGFSSDNNS